ncbi:MAG: flagellar filament capping protein FliD [Vicinamibacterales bacterium]
MSSGITFSGFNGVDFNLVLNSIMQQESLPLQQLQAKQTAVRRQVANFTQLGTRLNAIQDAADDLSANGVASSFTAASSVPASVAASAGSGAVAGRYEVVVSQLARAQVTASTTTLADADTTVVADGGSITIGGQTIAISGSTTLSQLAAAINANADSPARAAVVQSQPGSYQLVLTGKSTGSANAFAVTSNLTGGTGLAFGANAAEATNAQLTVNNLSITSTTNTVEDVVPGTTLTLYRQDPTATIVVDVQSNPSALRSKIDSFVTAYNDFLKFAAEQSSSAGSGDQASIGRDPVLRQLRNELRSALTSSYPPSSVLRYLADIGLELQRDGTLEVDSAKLQEVLDTNADEVALLLAGSAGAPGAFTSIQLLMERYTNTDGLIGNAKDQLETRLDRFDVQVAAMQERLAVRRLALQKEFIAADQAMSLLKSQSGSLSSFGSSL